MVSSRKSAHPCCQDQLASLISFSILQQRTQPVLGTHYSPGSADQRASVVCNSGLRFHGDNGHEDRLRVPRGNFPRVYLTPRRAPVRQGGWPGSQSWRSKDDLHGNGFGIAIVWKSKSQRGQKFQQAVTEHQCPGQRSP